MKSFLVNKKSFKSLDNDALSFFETNGFAVVEGVYSQTTLDRSTEELDRLRGRYAEELEMTIDDYDKRICQWRDLWMQNTHFNEFLRMNKMIETAKFFLRQHSIQLLHDHVIRKPITALNETVPWHQDFPFWPVDTPNSLSCWIPLEQVEENGGCLEVIVGSHLWGASPPVDFMLTPYLDISSINSSVPSIIDLITCPGINFLFLPIVEDNIILSTAPTQSKSSIFIIKAS